MTDGGTPTRGGSPVSRNETLALGVAGAIATVIAAKWHLPGLGNDATSYVAIADNLARHGHLGYFLEQHLTLWPPGWPAVLAFFEWAFGVRPQTTALVINSLGVIVVAFQARWLMRRLTSDRRLVLAAVAIAALGPATLSQSYEVQTEITFLILVLASFMALIRFADERRLIWLGAAAVAQWGAFMDRYVGIVAIGAGALWLLFERGESRFIARLRNAVGWGIAAFIVPGLWLVRNIHVTGRFASAFGPRDTPVATYKTNGLDAATSIGQFIHGVSQYAPFHGILRVLSLLLALVVIAIAVELYRRAAAARGSSWTNLGTFGRALGNPAGLLVIYAVAHWVYMVYSASTIAFDPVNTRYLMPMFIPAMLAGFALVDRGGGLTRPGITPDAFTRLVSAALVVLVVVQVGVGLIRVSASYWDQAPQGYDASVWQTTLHSPVLHALPKDCQELYANFPEAMYLAFPHIEAQRSPRITKFASSDKLRELPEAVAAVDAGKKSCLIWVKPSVLATPTYQHPLSDIAAKVDLKTLASDDHVAVYLMEPKGSAGT